MPSESTAKATYLIIGNSAGGIGAAEAIREVDRAGSIIIVSDEPCPAYSRPLIAKYLSREQSQEDMLLRSADFYERNEISALLGTKAAEFLPGEHVAKLDNGRHIVWQKLLLATGGMPIVPKIEGMEKKGVFTFLTLDDAKAIDQFIKAGRKAVVIGGGLIGVSVTEALVKRGVEVAIVEMKERVLNTILDEQCSGIAAEALRKAGVELFCDQTVTQVLGDERVTGVMLSSMDLLPCDLLVVAIGVVPRLDLVGGTSMELNRGMVVDRHMRTSLADVYACGDAAEAYDFVYRSNRLTPVWPNAYIGGRTAGFNMAGAKVEYPGGTAMNSLNYFGLDITAAGIVVPPDGDGYQSLAESANGTYRKLVIRDDALVGLICVGDIEKSGILYSLMRDGTSVASFKKALLTPDFGLASLPRPLWQERLGKPAEPVSPRDVSPDAGEERIASE